MSAFRADYITPVLPKSSLLYNLNSSAVSSYLQFLLQTRLQPLKIKNMGEEGKTLMTKLISTFLILGWQSLTHLKSWYWLLVESNQVYSLRKSFSEVVRLSKLTLAKQHLAKEKQLDKEESALAYFVWNVSFWFACEPLFDVERLRKTSDLSKSHCTKRPPHSSLSTLLARDLPWFGYFSCKLNRF